MFRFLTVSLILAGAFAQDKESCSYWCYANCIPKHEQMYCCGTTPELVGLNTVQQSPCPDSDICLNRVNDDPKERNCMSEKTSFINCRNFKDCDKTKHNACCTDKCVDKKICIV